MVSFPQLLIRFFRLYWRSIFVVVLPPALLPVFQMNDNPSLRCLYVALIMAGYWVTEALPLPVTALIPMVLFPLMGILDSDRTSLCYLKETSMMIVGALLIAIAVEHCNLHRRVALFVMLLMGCSPRRLNIGLVSVTMFVSMWTSNIAAIAMMCPIIEATLKELESQGIGSVYVTEENPEECEKLMRGEDGDAVNDANARDPAAKAKEAEHRRPSNTTICYFLSGAYAASIGGLGCIVGSGTNLTFKRIYESIFLYSPGIEFAAWLFLNVPMMLITMFLTWVWLQFLFMGLFRPNSEDAKNVRLGKQGEEVARKVIRQKIKELGPMKFHEIAVGVLSYIAVLLWFFRRPQFITGWSELITYHNVLDATAALIVVLLLFVIPARPEFIYMFSRNENKRPRAISPPLITWKVVQQKLPLGLIFLLGGSFALAEGLQESGMNEFIAEQFEGLSQLSQFVVLIIATLLASTLTEFLGNVAVANVILPVLAEMSIKAKWHPLYLMMPAAISCSFAFCLPVATPPNAIAAAPCNIPTKEMVKAGLGVSMIAIVVLWAIFPILGQAIYHLDKFPDWVLQQ